MQLARLAGCIWYHICRCPAQIEISCCLLPRNGVTQAFLDFEIEKMQRHDGEIVIPPFITKAVSAPPMLLPATPWFCLVPCC